MSNEDDERKVLRPGFPDDVAKKIHLGLIGLVENAEMILEFWNWEILELIGVHAPKEIPNFPIPKFRFDQCFINRSKNSIVRNIWSIRWRLFPLLVSSCVPPGWRTYSTVLPNTFKLLYNISPCITPVRRSFSPWKIIKGV
jgi:hypothetical protein